MIRRHYASRCRHYFADYYFFETLLRYLLRRRHYGYHLFSSRYDIIIFIDDADIIMPFDYY